MLDLRDVISVPGARLPFERELDPGRLAAPYVVAFEAAPRGAVLYDLDRKAELRFSHENPAVHALYQEYLDAPCSEKAEHLLHCDHFAWQMPKNRRE